MVTAIHLPAGSCQAKLAGVTASTLPRLREVKDLLEINRAEEFAVRVGEGNKRCCASLVSPRIRRRPRTIEGLGKLNMGSVVRTLKSRTEAGVLPGGR